MGDPASALLEVLDPEQNNSFSDHYLEVPYDLSDVFFIGTANSLRDIPEPLRDRMEIIQIHSYTTIEKFNIAKRHLMDEVLENHGLTPEQLKIEDNTIKTIIDKYTREAGVRGLKKQLSAIARHATEKIIVDEVRIPYTVKEEMLFDILGPEISRYDKVKKSNSPGVVTGLAWTPVGGDILFIERNLNFLKPVWCDSKHLLQNDSFLVEGSFSFLKLLELIQKKHHFDHINQKL